MELVKLVMPIYLVVGLGWWVRRKNLYGREVDAFMSFITYRLLLPLSIFSKISTADIALNKDTLLFFAVQFALMILAYLAYRFFFQEQAFEAFINTVRGNNIYLGFPVMMQLLPSELLPMGMVFASILSPTAIFGIEIVHRFEVTSQADTERTSSGVLSNPLVRALVVGFIFNVLNIWHPFLGELIGTMTKPLMFLSLLIVGANFNLSEFRSVGLSLDIVIVLVAKLIMAPLFFFGAARLLHFGEGYLLIGLVLFSTPGAATNYILAKEMGYDSTLTINATLIGTAIYLAMLPLLGLLIRTV